MVSGTTGICLPCGTKEFSAAWQAHRLPSLQQTQNKTNRANRQGTGKSAPQQAGEWPALAELDTAEAATHSCLCTL